MVLLDIDSIQEDPKQDDRLAMLQEALKHLDNKGVSQYVEAYLKETNEMKRSRIKSLISRDITTILYGETGMGTYRRRSKMSNASPIPFGEVKTLQRLMRTGSGYRVIQEMSDDGSVRTIDLFKFIDLPGANIETIVNQSYNPYKKAQLAYIVEILLKRLPADLDYDSVILTEKTFLETLHSAGYHLKGEAIFRAVIDRKRIKYPKKRFVANTLYAFLTPLLLASGVAAGVKGYQKLTGTPLGSLEGTASSFMPEGADTDRPIFIDAQFYPTDDSPILVTTHDGVPVPALSFNTTPYVDPYSGSLLYFGNAGKSAETQEVYHDLNYSQEEGKEGALSTTQVVPLSISEKTIVQMPYLV
ncbi:MAG: hypothetical protein ACMG6E_01105 [Candidatus Roizmanbacteria bacterium]